MQGENKRRWTLLCSLLAKKFRNEIEICAGGTDAGLYDIEIAG